MNVTVDIHNHELGEHREVTDATEQLKLLCAAIAHADRSEGFEVRALLRLAYELTGEAFAGAQALLSAAAVACHGVRCPVDEAADTLEDNMNLCAEAEAERPVTS